MERKNAILELSFEFALLIVAYCHRLENEKRYIIANQLMKSGTAIGANVKEAQNAESLSDFIHKFKIAAKEAEETEYWLMICQKTLNYPQCSDIMDRLIELKKILNKIISSAKNNTSNMKSRTHRGR